MYGKVIVIEKDQMSYCKKIWILYGVSLSYKYIKYFIEYIITFEFGVKQTIKRRIEHIVFVHRTTADQTVSKHVLDISDA